MANIDSQNQVKMKLREQMQQMQAKLRRLEVTIRSAEVENTNLKNVAKAEEELRKIRNDQEAQILSVASKAQTESFEWTSGICEEVSAQNSEVVERTSSLKLQMSERQMTNVQRLLSNIKEDMAANQTEMETRIPTFIAEYEAKSQDLTLRNATLTQQVELLGVDFRKNKAEEDALAS